MQITFELTQCEESGGYIARWDDPSGGGICTQGDSFADLDDMVRDAVSGYFGDREKPASTRNGIPLFPVQANARIITVDIVKSLAKEAD